MRVLRRGLVRLRRVRGRPPGRGWLRSRGPPCLRAGDRRSPRPPIPPRPRSRTRRPPHPRGAPRRQPPGPGRVPSWGPPRPRPRGSAHLVRAQRPPRLRPPLLP
ncbi:hypothetical protein DCW30_14900 [Streptomyces alfalfae]|nr:hypothetical protein D3X13_03680 [Streptomyces fradiae]RXX43876.1 hypothetical protein DCW30_14900 [Streptomyces alfalfae]